MELNIKLCVHMNDTWEYEEEMEEAKKHLFGSQASAKKISPAMVSPVKTQENNKKKWRKQIQKARRNHRKK
jgi:hypothetical protein